MITIRKLSTLKPLTRLRKIVRLLEEAEAALSGEAGGSPPDRDYLTRLGEMAGSAADEGSRESPARVIRAGKLLAQACHGVARSSDQAGLDRALNGLRHALLGYLGEEAAEWDLRPRDVSAARPVRPLPITVYLEDIRSPFNVGSIVRTSAAFGIEQVVLSPDCASLEHPRALRSAMGAERLVRVERRELGQVAVSAAHLFALELGGTPLSAFRFPPAGVVVVGSEELGIGAEALRLADQRDGRVTIPLRGPKASLNVGVAAGILLSMWVEKLTAAGPW